MSQALSKKIKYVSFLSMIAVIFIHAYNYTDTFLQSTTKITEGLNFSAMLEYFISNGITRFALPIFFIISAFFLFRRLDNNLKDYGKQLKKRCKTILVPWLIFVAFWTVITFILYFIPATSSITLIQENLAVLNNGTNVFGIIFSLITSPTCFQLWYLWTLLLLVIISPLYYLFVKQLKGIPIIILFVLWLFNITYFINIDAIFFFGVGALIAVNFEKLEKYLYNYKSKTLSIIIFVLYILFNAMYTYLAASKSIETPDILRNIIFKINQLLSVVAIWRICDNFGSLNDNNILVKLCPCSFILFVTHEPIQHFVFQSVLNENSSDISHLLVFFVVPIILIIFAYFLDKLLRKAPKLHSILTGNR